MSRSANLVLSKKVLADFLLPEGTTVHKIWEDTDRFNPDLLFVVVEHDSFPDVKEGDMLPVVQVIHGPQLGQKQFVRMDGQDPFEPKAADTTPVAP